VRPVFDGRYRSALTPWRDCAAQVARHSDVESGVCTGIDGDLGYPSTVELDDGTLLSVWYEKMKEPKVAVLRQAKWRM
jgi:hypothetical protein